MYKLFYDGACNPNPGPVGVGAVLISPSGEEVATVSRRGLNGTNNTAEYDALIAGLEMALSHGVTELVAYGDSKLITMQARGEWDCNNEALYQRLMDVKRLSQCFQRLHFDWVKREKNTRADDLSKKALRKPLNAPHEEKPRQPDASPAFVAKAFPGVGIAISDGKQIFTINFHPFRCSCGAGDSCEHINYLKEKLEQRGSLNVSDQHFRAANGSHQRAYNGSQA